MEGGKVKVDEQAKRAYAHQRVPASTTAKSENNRQARGPRAICKCRGMQKHRPGGQLRGALVGQSRFETVSQISILVEERPKGPTQLCPRRRTRATFPILGVLRTNKGTPESLTRDGPCSRVICGSVWSGHLGPRCPLRSTCFPTSMNERGYGKKHSYIARYDAHFTLVH